MSKAGRTRHSSSALLPPFHGASETERLLPRVDNVCPIRDPIQQRFTQSGIWKHRCPFREGQVCGHDDRRPLWARVVTQLPANPWHPYEFQEEQLKERIARQIASVELN